MTTFTSSEMEKEKKIMILKIKLSAYLDGVLIKVILN